MAGISQTNPAGGPLCPQCRGTGWKLSAAGSGGEVVASRCDCRTLADARRLWEDAQVPPRYQHCTLENFVVPPGAPANLETARLIASGFVENYPGDLDRRGLLFTGSVGVGKTHLAVAIAHKLVEERGVVCRFADYRELLKRIQASFDPAHPLTEAQIVQPLQQAEVLVLDDLGVGRATEWALETLHYLLNDRYNQQRTTLITTNLGDVGGGPDSPTLAKAVGERLRSRLHEMCKTVSMGGDDFRRKERKF